MFSNAELGHTHIQTTPTITKLKFVNSQMPILKHEVQGGTQTSVKQLRGWKDGAGDVGSSDGVALVSCGE